MRLCEHLHAFSQGWLSKVLSRKGPSSHVLEPHVTHQGQDSSRHTRRARASQPLRRSTARKTSVCRGNGACSMLYITLISISHNHMASHIVTT
jgi:hypothetical protein